VERVMVRKPQPMSRPTPDCRRTS